MASLTSRLLLISIIVLFSPLINAASCADILSRIGRDIHKQDEAMQSKNPVWMSIAWLQQNLTKPSVKKISVHHGQYTWLCNDENFLTVQTEASGKILEMNGKYSNKHGGGVISFNSSSVNAPGVSIQKP